MKNLLLNTAFISLGSNKGQPTKQLNLALINLEKSTSLVISKVSKYYQSQPYGYTEQNCFINAVIKIKTSFSCHQLLAYLQQIELKQKRMRTIKWGPRTLDLDILVFNNDIINTDLLTIPHYDLQNRDFVIIPWYEIEPNWALPDGTTIKNLFTRLTEQLCKSLVRSGPIVVSDTVKTLVRSGPIVVSDTVKGVVSNTEKG